MGKSLLLDYYMPCTQKVIRFLVVRMLMDLKMACISNGIQIQRCRKKDTICLVKRRG